MITIKLLCSYKVATMHMLPFRTGTTFKLQIQVKTNSHHIGCISNVTMKKKEDHKHKSITKTPLNLIKHTFKAFSKARAKACVHASSATKLTRNTVYFKYYPYNRQKQRVKYHCKHAQYLLCVYESPEVIYPRMEHINMAKPMTKCKD